MNKLFADKEMQDVVKYIKDKRLKTSNDEFEIMLNNRLNPSLTSISSSLTTPSDNENQYQGQNTPAFDDADMKIEKTDSISILGY